MLELRNITHSFPGVKALQGVSLLFKAGEVHAVCGENGAGKTTLMNIIAGNISADEGELYFDGHKIAFSNISDAQNKGIGIVYQERSLVDSLTVAENIFPVQQPRNRFGLIDRKELNRRAALLLTQLGLEQIPVQSMLRTLSPSQKQLVEIAKALSKDPKLLILDEPTASLTNPEITILFRLIKDLLAKNTAIIYISHRMGEIKEIATRISVLKDGAYQGTFLSQEVSIDFVIGKMVGRELQSVAYNTHKQKEKLLQINGLTGNGFQDIGFTLHRGEILGFAGLQGSGRTALMRAIFGDIECSGTILKENKQISPAHPADAIASGIAYLPDERKTFGLFMAFSITDNVGAVNLNTWKYERSIVRQKAEHICSALNIRTRSITQPVQLLSGGNQQKVLLGKWLENDPDILIVNEPTHGVDIGAKSEIYDLLKTMTAAGKGVLLISSELTELLLLSDRIAVMYRGGLRGILENDEADEKTITALASGLKS